MSMLQFRRLTDFFTEREKPKQRECAGSLSMTTVQITLPDALAQEATQAGLLAPEKMERMLREGLRQERIERMKSARATLAAQPLVAMTPEEIRNEIDAYRTEQRRAAGS